jgi:hypothetical protein
MDNLKNMMNADEQKKKNWE